MPRRINAIVEIHLSHNEAVFSKMPSALLGKCTATVIEAMISALSGEAPLSMYSSNMSILICVSCEADSFPQKLHHIFQ